MKTKTKETRIKSEKKRLLKIFGDMEDEKKLKTAQGLIERAAYMRVTLEDCESDIIDNGLTEKFAQGQQEPYDRKRPVADLYNTMNTSYQKIIKQLIDLLPEETKTDVDPFITFINSNPGG